MGAHRDLPANYDRFFHALGDRIRSYRVENGMRQEDMIFYGFSVRHWQKIEGGQPMTVFTLLRVSETFQIPLDQMLAGLNHHLRKRK